ncbi:DUF5330 domain-containing protein [Rhizobium sp. YIM 134829]|uniref:DUF5330 domain-containing protein n=1 Tax=Rhizobium sp. YIM 134829 TaxID=3390453 RepID=UPI00397A58A8
MWFLIKGTFWFAVVLLVLPFFVGEEAPESEATAAKVDVADTVTAATEALGYLSGLCSEKPDVCVKGAETFTALGHRAREGARIAYELLDAQFGSKGDPVMTGTIAEPKPTTTERQDPEADAALATVGASDHGAEAAEALPLRRIPVPEWRLDPAAGRH